MEPKIYNNIHILIKPIVAFVLLIFIGAYLLSFIEGIEFYDSVYKTFLLAATVTSYPASTSAGRVISIVIVVVGLGLILYTATSITRFLMKIDIKNTIRRKTGK